MEKRHAPVLRLKGFTDDWEQRKLGSIVCDYSEKNPVDEDLPILTSSRQGIQKQEEHFGSEQRHDTIDYNVIPRGYCTYRNRSDDRTFTFNVNDCIERGIVSKFYPVFSIDNGNAKFVTEYLNNNFEIKNKLAVLSVGTSQVVLSLNNLKSLDIQIPSKDEQEKIGGYFNSFDSLITLHQRKLEKLQNIKKAMLEKMFPKNEEKTPKIRFSGFTSDWEQRKLRELGKALSGVGFPDEEQGGKEGIPFYKVSDMNNAGNEQEMVTANNYVTSEQIARKRWKPIDEVPAIFFAKVGAAVLLNRKRLCRFPFLFDNNTMAYLMNKNVFDADFAKTLFETIDLTSLVQVGALPSYNAGDVEGIEVSIPKMEEQQKIGFFFINIDHLIALHQRKLEKLQNIKKAMLEKMFV